MEWLRTLPPAITDPALNAVVQRAVKDLEWHSSSSLIPLSTAADFAAQIGNSQARETALESLANAWLKASPDAAREWLNSAPLSTSVKQRLLDSRSDAASGKH